ncbi:hypothetical protein A0H76_2682 [Hepatospora eriocheir]|uniref:Uncharacterized protein n=1 Tax=Hepatospora eriocheir TaxID=1081669 RepID=A0A1X0QEY8_9MICR|nr:hypothetical protein A0H76_2682 [Hepatospora eriocheir]
MLLNKFFVKHFIGFTLNLSVPPINNFFTFVDLIIKYLKLKVSLKKSKLIENRTSLKVNGFEFNQSQLASYFILHKIYKFKYFKKQ